MPAPKESVGRDVQNQGWACAIGTGDEVGFGGGLEPITKPTAPRAPISG